MEGNGTAAFHDVQINRHFPLKLEGLQTGIEKQSILSGTHILRKKHRFGHGLLTRAPPTKFRQCREQKNQCGRNSALTGLPCSVRYSAHLPCTEKSHTLSSNKYLRHCVEIASDWETQTLVKRKPEIGRGSNWTCAARTTSWCNGATENCHAVLTRVHCTHTREDQNLLL